MKASLPFKYIIAIKNGKQYVVFDYKDGNGKRKRKWVGTGLPEKCAKKALNEKVEEIVAEFYESYLSGNMSVSEPKKHFASTAVINPASLAESIADYSLVDYLAYWYNTIKSTLAYNTVIEYERFCRLITKYFNEKFPGLKLKDVNALHIQQYYNDLYNSGRKGKTVRCYHAFLHSAFKYAVKIDLLPGNPTEKTELPRKEKREATYYTKEELEKLFEAFKGDRMELVVHIAAYYGLRRGEILGLNWDSIDFDNKTLTVRRKITSSFKNNLPSC